MLEMDCGVRLETNGWILNNFGKRWAQAIDLQAPILAEIARAAELLVQLRLYELLINNTAMANAPVRVREPPAGPPKLAYELTSGRFSENFIFVSPTGMHFYVAKVFYGANA